MERFSDVPDWVVSTRRSMCGPFDAAIIIRCKEWFVWYNMEGCQEENTNFSTASVSFNIYGVS